MIGFYAMAVVAFLAIARGFYLTKKLRELEDEDV